VRSGQRNGSVYFIFDRDESRLRLLPPGTTIQDN
jgi:hypothetical protein